MDTDERYIQGEYDNYETALKVCKSIVDEFLQRDGNYSNMTAEKLYQAYVSFGDDPWIMDDDGPMEIRFSAWDYAKEQCEKLCKK
jgi:hypothetical protein